MRSDREMGPTVLNRLKCLVGLHALRAPAWVPVDQAGIITRSHFIATCVHCAHRREVYVTN